MDYQNNNSSYDLGGNTYGWGGDDHHKGESTPNSLLDNIYNTLILHGTTLARLQTRTEKLISELDEKNSTISEYEKTIKKLQGKLKKMEQEINKTNENIRNARNKTIEPLSVFVGLFTFASVSFSMLSSKNLSEKTFITILFILLGSVIVFAALVIHASSITSDLKDRRIWTGALIGIGLFSVIIGLLCFIYA